MTEQILTPERGFILKIPNVSQLLIRYGQGILDRWVRSMWRPHKGDRVEFIRAPMMYATEPHTIQSGDVGTITNVVYVDYLGQYQITVTMDDGRTELATGAKLSDMRVLHIAKRRKAQP